MLFAPEWKVPPVPLADNHQQMLEDLGVDPESVFLALDPRLAAAWVVQVRR